MAVLQAGDVPAFVVKCRLCRGLEVLPPYRQDVFNSYRDGSHWRILAQREVRGFHEIVWNCASCNTQSRFLLDYNEFNYCFSDGYAILVSHGVAESYSEACEIAQRAAQVITSEKERAEAERLAMLNLEMEERSRQ